MCKWLHGITQNPNIITSCIYLLFIKICVNGYIKQCGALVHHIWKLNGDGRISQYYYLQSDFAFGPCFTLNPHFAPKVCTHKINKFDKNMVLKNLKNRLLHNLHKN